MDTAECIPGEYEPTVKDYDPYILKDFPAPKLPDPIPVWEISLKLTFYVLAFIVDIVGNSLVILIIIFNKRMRTQTNYLIVNLAISDLMVGLFCMWVHAGNQLTAEWPFGSFMCKVNIFFQVLAVTASVLTLTVISAERFIAIVFPLKARMSAGLTFMLMATTWLLSAVMAGPHLWTRRHYELYFSNRHRVWCEEVWPKVYIDTECNTEQPGRAIYYTVEGVVMYFMPIAVMLVAYTLIVIKIVRRKAPGTRLRPTASGQLRSKKKVIRMLVAVLVAFVICWTPQQVLLLWDVYRDRTDKPGEYVYTIKYIAVYVAYLNSAVNPVLYGGFNENFRHGFKEAFTCHMWSKRSRVGPAADSTARPASNTTAVCDSVV